jgi:hypothetical protein
MRPTFHVATALCLLAPALLAAQARPRGAPRDTTPAADSAAARRRITGFEPGHLYVGPRTWLGIYGTVSVGGQAEIAVSRPGQFGPGTLGAGASVDLYHYGDRFGPAEWSVTVLPIGGHVNYHFPLEDRRIDPYVGLGLGVAVVSASVRSADGAYEESAGRASGVFSFGTVGARYFFRPDLAVQAQTGWGFGGISIGVTWKR